MHLDARSTSDLGLVTYDEGLRIQSEFARRREAGEIGDTLLLCEHPPIYTLGTNADPSHVLDAGEIEVRQTDRGGEVTFHGPGQVVGYAICDLDRRQRDLHRHCRDLEEVMIRAIGDFGLEARRMDGWTGVWVGSEKIGALGVRVRRWISTHGFALNVCCDLRYYEGIVPCGIQGCRVTTLERRLGRPVSIDAVRETCAAHFAEVFHA